MDARRGHRKQQSQYFPDYCSILELTAFFRLCWIFVSHTVSSGLTSNSDKTLMVHNFFSSVQFSSVIFRVA